MPLSRENFRALTESIKNYSGIVVSEGKDYLLESRLLPVARKYSLEDLDSLTAYMRENNDGTLLVEIVEAMTTNESFFFRDIKPFEMLQKQVFPLFANLGRKVRIWSAACSTGQEAYSIAMSAMEAGMGDKIHITASDIDSSVVEKAKLGSYSQFEVQRGLPVNMLIKYLNKTVTHGT